MGVVGGVALPPFPFAPPVAIVPVDPPTSELAPELLPPELLEQPNAAAKTAPATRAIRVVAMHFLAIITPPRQESGTARLTRKATNPPRIAHVVLGRYGGVTELSPPLILLDCRGVFVCLASTFQVAVDCFVWAGSETK